MARTKILPSLVCACLLLTLPATILAANKVDDAKSKLEQMVRDRHSFNPFRHKGDLAIVLSSLGVLIGGLRLYVALRKRHAKPVQPPAFTPPAGPR